LIRVVRGVKNPFHPELKACLRLCLSVVSTDSGVQKIGKTLVLKRELPPTCRWSPEYEGKKERTNGPSVKYRCQFADHRSNTCYNQCTLEESNELQSISRMQVINREPPVNRNFQTVNWVQVEATDVWSSETLVPLAATDSVPVEVKRSRLQATAQHPRLAGTLRIMTSEMPM
ncbi:hypothetical protein HAX54_035920, partial [Datura stramonium]|nr:hypothetical protein [Datura stramonium]